MTTVSNLEAHWARYVVGLPHAFCMRTPQAAMECAVHAVGCDRANSVLVTSGAPPYVAAAVLSVGGIPQDVGQHVWRHEPGDAVGIVVSWPVAGPLPWYDSLVQWCMQHGLWIIEDCGTRLDVGRASHAAVCALVGGIAACLDDRVAARMSEHRAREGWGMSEEDAVACVAALGRLRGC